MDAVRRIDGGMLESLSAEARGRARLRCNLNFHASDAHPGHRLLNAIEPRSYIPPHCHLDPTKDETLLALRGRIGVLVFDATGTVVAREVLQPEGPVQGVDIPCGVIHSLVALEPGSVVFEAKAGPFLPRAPGELPGFAPPEGDPAAPAYLEWMRAQFA